MVIIRISNLLLSNAPDIYVSSYPLPALDIVAITSSVLARYNNSELTR